MLASMVQRSVMWIVPCSADKNGTRGSLKEERLMESMDSMRDVMWVKLVVLTVDVLGASVIST